ncbi:hypothetical protein C8Q77DRAFT_190158 [Trametes polyzona]|nr:hypothetical protein C8Q77DRAFT_190158 [Trametes polyzona]
MSDPTRQLTASLSRLALSGTPTADPTFADTTRMVPAPDELGLATSLFPAEQFTHPSELTSVNKALALSPPRNRHACSHCPAGKMHTSQPFTHTRRAFLQRRADLVPSLAFIRPYNLRVHMDCCHSPLVRRFQCPLEGCSCSFVRLRDCKRHVAIGHGLSTSTSGVAADRRDRPRANLSARDERGTRLNLAGVSGQVRLGCQACQGVAVSRLEQVMAGAVI